MIDLRSLGAFLAMLRDELLQRLQSTAVEQPGDELQQRRDRDSCCGCCDLGDGP